MIWRFFKFARGFLRIKTGKNVLLRFFVLQGRDTVEEGLEQQRKKRKLLMKRFQNEFIYLQLLRASNGKMYRSFYSNDHESQYNNDQAIHAIHLEHDTYIDDLETVASEYEGMYNGPNGFNVLESSFVQEV